MKVLYRSLFIFFIALLELNALPSLALRLNDRCSDCHSNPTGGIICNMNGWYYGKLPMSIVSPLGSENGSRQEEGRRKVIGRRKAIGNSK
ncbi:MAG: hypothetical protein KJ799_11910 [Bacteroidetes bacterium]|nr:hypothetical protein [Bacteroidota bacterium]MBU2507409.1 hypothetical protein [Bacteroidota bacterium]